LGTSPIPAGAEILDIAFDFVSHQLVARTSRGATETIALVPQTVAAFHAGLALALKRLGINVAINGMPNEIPNAIRFAEDHTHAAYDRDAAHRFWRALIQADCVFKLFRTGFLGKPSPVHFFWGSFDLAVTLKAPSAARAKSARCSGLNPISAAVRNAKLKQKMVRVGGVEPPRA
jgi:hypothetical protein